MKLSEIIKDIQWAIERFGDYELNSGAIYTDNLKIEVDRINKSSIMVNEEDKTAQFILMS